MYGGFPSKASRLKVLAVVGFAISLEGSDSSWIAVAGLSRLLGGSGGGWIAVVGLGG